MTCAASWRRSSRPSGVVRVTISMRASRSIGSVRSESLPSIRTATASRSSRAPMLRATVPPSTGEGNERCDPSGSVRVGMAIRASTKKPRPKRAARRLYDNRRIRRPEGRMSELTIHMFPCLADNYGYLLHDAESQATAAVDTPDAREIEVQLRAKGWGLTHILNTHHHGDHAGGNLELKRKTGCTIIGSRADAARIPGIDVSVGDGDVVQMGAHRAAVYDTPGHTRGHIVYHFAAARAAFVGDTLFALGCGRLFEGTPAEMWGSLQKILRWPDDTRLYCAHEYTQSNA